MSFEFKDFGSRYAAEMNMLGMEIALDSGDPLYEMPYYDREDGKTLDLRVERWPISNEEKKKIFRMLFSSGAVAELDGETFVFTPENNIEKATSEQIRTLPKLPEIWKTHMVVESKVKLADVFVIKESGAGNGHRTHDMNKKNLMNGKQTQKGK